MNRYSAARPKRAGENYARTHHGAAGGGSGTGTGTGGSEPDSKKVKFDVRNPSALAPDAGDEDDDEEQDAYLEADAEVIRGSAATKRNAVNIDGYDSDSDREEMGKLHASASSKAEPKKDADGDVDDMFAADDDDDNQGAKQDDDAVDETTGKKSKDVKFLDTAAIDGQELRSTSRAGMGDIRPGHADSGDDDSDDEEAAALAIEEEGVDEEVGAGGLKRHAPKVEAFNLKAESEEGKFDEAGNFVRKAVDPDAVHDRWLEGLSKKDMRRAAEAHEKREAAQRRQRREDDSLLTSDLLRSLIAQLERGETALEALARLGRGQAKTKKVPKWKQKKQQQKSKKSNEDSEAMEVDEADRSGKKSDGAGDEGEDPEQARIKAAINAITEAADKLLGRDRPDIYDRSRESLIREYQREADEPWVEPAREETESSRTTVLGEEGGAAAATAATSKMWEYRWTDGRDGADKQGPFDGATMKAWQDAGYFGEGVEFRAAGEDEWSRVVRFT